MSATTAGALKAYIESLGFPGLSAYRDRVPEKAGWPRVVIYEGIAIVPEHLGDNGDSDAVTETVQIDLFERWKSNGQMVESYDLASDLEKALYQADLPDAPKRVHGLSGVSRLRQLDHETNVVRNVITVEIRRDQ